jgi:hypothetical protein
MELDASLRPPLPAFSALRAPSACVGTMKTENRKPRRKNVAHRVRSYKEIEWAVQKSSGRTRE